VVESSSPEVTGGVCQRRAHMAVKAGIRSLTATASPDSAQHAGSHPTASREGG